jgi:transaldolase
MRSGNRARRHEPGPLVPGTLKALVCDKHVVGVTTNPTILHKAIAGSQVYAEELHDLAALDIPVAKAVRLLTTHDVHGVCDLLAPAYERSDQRRPRVHRTRPRVAHDTHHTIAEARLLWWMVDRPDRFIKIPATREGGLTAVTTCLDKGISVNVTLIFSLDRYTEATSGHGQR